MSAAPTVPPALPPRVPPGGPPAPSTGPAPTAPATERRSLPSFLAHEGGLLLLSLVLAFMVWLVVRTMVDTSRELRFQVEFVAPPDCRVFAQDHVELTLVGKQGELESVEQALGGDGGKVRLIVGHLDPGRDERAIRHGDDTYRLPFPMRLLKDPARPALPRGDVVRVRKGRVAVEPPPTPMRSPALPEGIEVEVTLLTPSLEVLAPAGALDGPLTPDPIDLTPFHDAAAGLAAPLEVTLSFEGWRRGPPGSRSDDPVVRRRAAVALPEARASLRFVLWERATLTNAVEVIVKRGYVVSDIRDPPGGSFTGERSSEKPGQSVEANFTGEVRTTHELLEQLRKSPDTWRWILRVRDEDLPTAAGTSKQVRATLSLAAFGSLALPLAQGYVVFEPLAVPVEVRTSP